MDGGWGSWGSYSKCTKECGTGTQKRIRSCDKPKPSNGGMTCKGKSEETRNCNQQKCSGIITIEYVCSTLKSVNGN